MKSYANIPVQNWGVSSVINVFLHYRDILIVEDTNVSLKKKHFSIDLLLVRPKGLTSSLAAFLQYIKDIPKCKIT